MSEPTDIKALDEYLKRDSEVSQRYRKLGRDEVPPELDRRVLAEARAAVADEGTKRSRSWLRWSAPVALAASVVLVVTVVLERGVQDQTVLLPQSPGEVRQMRPDSASRDQAANEAPQAKLADEVTRQSGPVPEAAPPAEVAVEAQAQRDSRFQEQTTPVTVVTVPAVPPPAMSTAEQISPSKSGERSEAEAKAEADSDLSEVAVTGSRARRATGRTAGPRNTISGSSFNSSKSRPVSDEQRERSDPQAWLEDIRDMRRAGKTAEADREWERFREAFPDFRVADDDIARKKP